ncbi:hypothetical protein P5V15_011295 [Pogonomyrmex californicus]
MAGPLLLISTWLVFLRYLSCLHAISLAVPPRDTNSLPPDRWRTVGNAVRVYKLGRPKHRDQIPSCDPTPDTDLISTYYFSEPRFYPALPGFAGFLYLRAEISLSPVGFRRLLSPLRGLRFRSAPPGFVGFRC